MDLSFLGSMKLTPVARFLPTAAVLVLYSMAYTFVGLRGYRDVMVLRSETGNPASPGEKLRRQYAMDGLERIRANGEFDTVLSNRGTVLEKCFPMNWEPGTLQKAFKRKEYEVQAQQGSNNAVDDRFRIVLVGGSASAWAPLNCQVGDDPLWGLYSNTLERALNNEDDHGVRKTDEKNEMPLFEIVNRAQGDTDSAQNAILVDHYIDPNQTDLLIHEFGINLHPQGKDMHEHALNLWLGSVNSLFTEVNRKVPPIIIMQFWRDSQALFPAEMRVHGLDDTVLHNQWEIINYYRSLGWAIQVINVAPGINGSVVANDTFIAFDDGHHQGCTVSRLISSMLQQAIFSNLATTASPDTLKSSPATNEIALAEQHQSLPLFQQFCQNKEVFDPFYCAFFDSPSHGARFGSLSPWTPSTGMSRLNFLSNTTASYKVMDHKIVNPMGAFPNRADRKLAWELSPCQDEDASSSENNVDNEHVLQFTLLEPDLKWIAFYGDNVYGNGAFRMRINGVAIDFSVKNLLMYYQRMGRLRTILHIPDIVPPAPHYTISFCRRDDHPMEKEGEERVFLHYLVAGVQETSREQKIVPFY